MTEFDSIARAPSVEDDSAAPRQTRIGFVLFGIYSAVYVVFILLNAFRADWMEWTPLAGLNLAVLYGFGLILGALLLALVYGWLCRQNPPSEPRSENRP